LMRMDTTSYVNRPAVSLIVTKLRQARMSSNIL
jgi:hypothetical protein